jgi:hypothetical protein
MGHFLFPHSLVVCNCISNGVDIVILRNGHAKRDRSQNGNDDELKDVDLGHCHDKTETKQQSHGLQQEPYIPAVRLHLGQPIENGQCDRLFGVKVGYYRPSHKTSKVQKTVVVVVVVAIVVIAGIVVVVVIVVAVLVHGIVAVAAVVVVIVVAVLVVDVVADVADVVGSSEDGRCWFALLG